MISVVIPLYNKEKSIATTLESVLAQSYTDYEIIVIDDGSTDNSANIVRKLGNEKIKLISQHNSGVSAARNAGIMAANGEYVAFLDADDLWSPNYLETLVVLIEDCPDAGLYSLGYAEIGGNEMPKSETTHQTIERGRIAQPWDKKYRVWTGSVTASKERMIKLGLFDTRMTYGEDLDMWWRLMLDGGLAVDPTCCAYYRQDTENRAMHKVIPLEKHIPYYIDKFADARASNADFRMYFDEQMVYRIYPYLFDQRYKKEARRIARRLDYSQFKLTMKWRMIFPHLYRLFTGR